jgi:hypothetical protein
MPTRICPTMYTISFILVLTLLCSCKEEITPAPVDHSSDVAYLNSFESAGDTAGWQGYGSYSFMQDAPLSGGKQSLYVSGGCLVPHAWKNFRNTASSSYIKLSCWGKRIMVGGIVSLRTLNNPSKSISCQISDSLWTSYHSSDSLFCAANDTLHLELISGGIVANSMLIDMLEVAQAH